MAFTTTQQTININQFLNNTKGALTGLTNFDLKLTGDTRAFGTFQGDPFGLGSGVVLSTGRVKDLPGKNTADGDFSPTNGSSPNTTTPLNFTKLDGRVGATGVFRADLSKIGFDLNSLTIADGGSGVGGAGGEFSGFDLDAIKLSNTLVTKAEDVAALPSLNVFDFSPAGTIFTPGTQRPSPFGVKSDLDGTLNGNINNAIATLGEFDATASGTGGSASLGVGGKVGFDLTSPVSTSDKPLFLYVGEAANNENAPAGNIAASDQSVSGISDLSTDFGTSGAADDTTSMEISFNNDNKTPQTVFFQFVVGSEELAEFGGSDLEDAFSFNLNGLDLAQLSEGEAVTINNLAPTPTTYHPDLIYNPVGTGPASNDTKLDGYTKVLTFAGPIAPGQNNLVIEAKDVRDGLFDSAVFLKGGTLGLIDPTNSPTPGGITVNGQPLQVSESGLTDSFTLALKTVSKNDVIITVNPDSELNLGKGGDNPLTLTFTPQNALTPQTVNVAAVDDKDIEGNHTGGISFKFDSSDPAYNGLSVPSLNVPITDNDFIPVPKIVQDISQSAQRSATEGERKSGFTVALNTAPKEDVTITIDPDKQLGLGIGPDNPLTLTFTPENALTPQAFEVTYVDDQAIEGDHTGILSFKASSDDPAFNNLSAPDLKLSIKDNEVFNTIEGTSGNDTLLGTDGSDRITGFEGQDTLTGSGGQDRFIIRQGDGTDSITDFGGVDPGVAPSPQTLLVEADILKFQGEGLTAETMLLTQSGSDLVIEFAGIQDTQVRLQNFDLEDLDNLNQSTGGSIDAGNILFNGQDQIQDSFDVINADWNPTQIFNPNSVTFLNDLDNDILGLDGSNDVINGQGGNDRLEGLKGDDLLRGGAGNDQFAIGVGKGTDTIADFTNGEDLIELCGCVSFEQLTIAPGTGANASNTLISVTSSNELLAVLTGVQANTITSLNFAAVS